MEEDPLRVGTRVFIRHPRRADGEAYVALVRASRDLHRPWTNLSDSLKGFQTYLAKTDGERNVGFFICRREDGAIAGLANVSQIVRGPFLSAFLGVNAFAPQGGKGYVTEGLGLVFDHVFAPCGKGGLGLHRLEGNVQPANERSRALVVRLGFRLEGFSERYLKIGGRWRDHERWALLREWWRHHRRFRDPVRRSR